MKEVYIILSPFGGISIDIFKLKGKCYTDLEEAKKELEIKNKWSAVKGYGVYELVTLEVIGEMKELEALERMVREK